MTRIVTGGLTVFLALAAAGSSAFAAQRRTAGAGADLCTVAAGVAPVRELAEGSGVALSRRTPGLLWSHNDSGPPMLIAFDASGAVKGRVTVAGARLDDWEDVSAGPCAQGSCLYIADIGDNNRARQRITVYRVPEPQPGDAMTAPAEALDAVYPDGPHDAEALIVTSADDLFIVTKAAGRETALYRFPKPVRPGTAARLEKVTALPLGRVTGGAASPDGAWVALRTNDEVVFFPGRQLLAGTVDGARRFNLRALREPQGEGVAFGAGGVVYLVGEGRPGTLASLKCALR